MNIKIGDTVKITSGKDRGKTGKVTKAIPIELRVVIEGVNIRKKHTRPKKQGQKGQIIQMAMPVDVSNVSIMCSSCKKAVRISKKVVGKKRVRVCNKCGGEL